MAVVVVLVVLGCEKWLLDASRVLLRCFWVQ